MNRPAAVIPVIIIVNACIWGFTMIMSSHALSGSDDQLPARDGLQCQRRRRSERALPESAAGLRPRG
jgi:hypothetical protein